MKIINKMILTITDKILGNGSYGDVFLIKDENQKEYAVKCCLKNKYGIPSIIEPIIMSTINHPNINSSILNYMSDEKLYMIQELAISDLSSLKKQKIELSKLKDWCFQLSQALYGLHNQNIIHCDIKSGNCLLFNNNNIKLTDFTISVLKLNNESKYNHNVCTGTHRPLECLLGKYWDESLDIWSLGCTFYEIAYGELLFPRQNNKDKLLMKKKYINAILDWGERGPIKEVIDKEYYNTKYEKFELHKNFFNPSMVLFNDLLLKMLRINPKNRLTIKEVINHPFFDNHKIVNYNINKNNFMEISISEYARINRYLEEWTKNKDYQYYAIKLYKFSYNIDIEEKLKINTCLFIVFKIFLQPITIFNNLDELILKELEICNYNNFILI